MKFLIQQLKSNLIDLFYNIKMRQQRSSKYAKISLKKRQKLISCVIEDKLSVSKAANRLGICISTAKMIVKRYREEGTFFESKNDKLKRLLMPQNFRRPMVSEEPQENLRINHQTQAEYQQNPGLACAINSYTDVSHLGFLGDCQMNSWMFFGNFFPFSFMEWRL